MYLRTLFATLALVAALPARATVPAESTARSDQIADGSTTAFAFTFPTPDKASVQVYVNEVLQASGYTVTLLGGGSSGGTVTFLSPPADDAVVRIQRRVAITQGLNLYAGSPFPAASVMAALDRQTYVAQQLERDKASAQGLVAETAARIAGDAATLASAQGYANDAVTGALAGTGAVPASWSFTGNGTSLRFPIAGAAHASAGMYVVALSGVLQTPGTDYSIDLGTQEVVFTVAPANGVPGTVRSMGYGRAVNIANDALVTASGSSAARSQADRAADVVNVKDFGAKGDGVTDNAPAFAAAAAVVNASSSFLTVYVPPGDYSYSGGLVFTKPVTLRGEPGSILRYTGSGIAAKFGPDGLVYATRHSTPYVVQGLEFRGGASMTQGLFFNTFVVYPRLREVSFLDFGNATAYAVFFQSDNWDIEMTRCSIVSADGATRNGVRVRGQTVGGVTDNGNSRLRFNEGHLTHPSGTGGVGIWLTGSASEVAHNKIEGFIPNVRVAAKARSAVVHENYFESYGNVIEFGDPAGGDDPGTYVDGLRVSGGYANLHHTTTGTGYFVAPSGVAAGLQNATIENFTMAAHDAREVAHFNTLGSQTGNTMNGIKGATSLYNVASGASVTEGIRLGATPAAIQGWGGASGNIDLAPVNDGGKVYAKAGFVHRRNAIAAGAAINTKLGDQFEVGVTATGAYTVPSPGTASTGQRITVRIKNTSGGAITATWNAAFKMVTWTDPATGFSRTIDFIYDGANWVQATTATPDIPN